MHEIGLEVGTAYKIYDQDTGEALKFDGADIVAPGHYRGRQTIEFDPYNNRKMMGCLFGHFLNKHAEEVGEDSYAVSFYNVDDSSDGGRIECKFGNNSKVRSERYTRDSLRYTDVIIRLNGGTPDLKKFDVPIERSTVKRGGSKKCQNSNLQKRNNLSSMKP